MKTQLILALILAPALAATPAFAQADPATADPASPAAGPAATEAPAPATALSTHVWVGLKGGYFAPTSKLGGAFYGAAEVGIAPWMGGRLGLSLEGDYYRPALSGTVTSPQLTVNGNTADGSYTLKEQEIAALLSVIYRLPTGTRFVPYAGVGPGYYWHQATTTAFGTTNVETEGSVGFHALIGVDLKLGPGAALFEVHYHFSQVDFLATGSANVGGFLAASLGYRLSF